MKLYGTLFTVILLIGLSVPGEGLFSGTSLQDYVESFVDTAKLQFDEVISMNDSAISHIWSFFKSKYGRVYSSFDEEKQRLRVFRDHLQYVLKTNLDRLRTFQLELNEFADWTLDEFNSFKKGLIVSTSLRRNFIADQDDDDDEEAAVQRSLKRLYQHHYHLRRLKRNLHQRRYKDRRFFTDWFWNIIHKDKKNNTNQPSSVFDWRTKSAVSSIKNQLKCGCCYAFATTAVLETLYAMKTKSQTAMDFSAQQIADCSSNGNNGCNGGNFPPSVRYLMGQGGKIATEASYPYVGQKQACRTNNLNQINVGTIAYGAIPQGDETKLAEAVTNYGPVFIGLDAESRLFMFYKAGVLNINNCPNRQQDMDHALVIVGYGYDNALQMSYWIIKNSWGAKWGENGYLRLAKDAGNMCGVASMAFYGKLTYVGYLSSRFEYFSSGFAPELDRVAPRLAPDRTQRALSIPRFGFSSRPPLDSEKCRLLEKNTKKMPLSKYNPSGFAWELDRVAPRLAPDRTRRALSIPRFGFSTRSPLDSKKCKILQKTAQISVFPVRIRL